MRTNLSCLYVVNISNSIFNNNHCPSSMNYLFAVDNTLLYGLRFENIKRIATHLYRGYIYLTFSNNSGVNANVL